MIKVAKIFIFHPGMFSSIFGHQGGTGATLNDLIMSGRLIQLFKHLECQNPSIISDSIGIPRWKSKMGGKSGAGVAIGGILFILKRIIIY